MTKSTLRDHLKAIVREKFNEYVDKYLPAVPAISFTDFNFAYPELGTGILFSTSSLVAQGISKSDIKAWFKGDDLTMSGRKLMISKRRNGPKYVFSVSIYLPEDIDERERTILEM